MCSVGPALLLGCLPATAQVVAVVVVVATVSAQQERTAAPTAQVAEGSAQQGAARLQEPAAKQVQPAMGSAAKAAMGSAAKALQHCHCLAAFPRLPSWPGQPACGPPSP